MKNKLEDRILKQLAKRKKGYTNAEVAKLASCNVDYSLTILRKLVKAWKVERVGNGSRYTKPVYRIPESFRIKNDQSTTVA